MKNNKLSKIRIGTDSYGQAIKLLFTRKFAIYLIFPVILNIILAYVMSLLSGNLYEASWEYIKGLLSLDGDLTGFLYYLEKVLSGLFWLMSKLLFFFMYLFVGGYLIITLLTPVYAHLSEKTEKHLYNQEYKVSVKDFINDIGRGIIIALRNIMIELGWTIVLFIVGLIPIIGLLSPFVLFFISAYYYGFSFIDYSLERKRYTIRDSIEFGKRNRWAFIGNGAVFTLTLAIPVIGTTLAGFTSLVSVMAGTIATEKLVNSERITVNEQN